MTEKVRLIIWDLDETFWYGTLTEGGIRIRPEVCELIKTLARRGIMSSICSKNNFDDIKPILEREGVWEYFIFPSVNWDTKGPRIAAIVDAVQLRAPTVMFIDDNPMNLEEARDAVPGLQVQSHEFIPEIADHPLFVGKNDEALSRLQQYKLLETRKQDEAAAPGDNSDFLRRSDIRVYIEHDIHAHMDRAIELINRTNQLNYTKRRLPEDMDEARRILSEQLGKFDTQAGLVRVVDKYGDYGFVGFYLSATGRREVVENAAWQRLQYYCFSCRTLGMLVEHWLYDYLRRPELNVAGEVLTDLSVPRQIDWVRMVSSLSEGAAPVEKIAPEIRLHGGCEANALAHYLAAYADKMMVTGNFATGGLFVRLNAVSFLLSAASRIGSEFERESKSLGVPYHAMAFDFFEHAPEGTVFVFSGGMDETAGGHRYRHKQHGWDLKIEPNGMHALDCVREDSGEVEQKIVARNYAAAEQEQILAAARHVGAHYESIGRGDEDHLCSVMRTLFGRVPQGSKLILILGAERGPFPDGTVKTLPWVINYNKSMRTLAAEFPFVTALSFGEFAHDDSEIHGNGHYGRMVYCRLAEAIADAVRTPPRIDDAVAAE